MDEPLNNENNLSDTATILVIDDQEPFLKLFKRFFQRTNYTIVATSSPEEALELIEKNPIYDLVVTDVMMPVLSGYDVCRKIREKYSMFELPVLFLTARMESVSVIEGFDAGGNDYVTKPFETAELFARTSTLVKLKKLYETNKILHSELVERNKFLQMNIHDLKSPLTSVTVLAGMIQRDIIHDEENCKNLDVIINSAEQMVSLVNQILEYNNLENKNITLEFNNTNINDILSQVVDVQKPLAMQKYQNLIIKREVSEEACVLVDSEKVVRAVNNILGNAIKYSPLSKPITAHLKPIHNESGHFVRLEIADEGPGFSDSERSNVFNKFGRYSAKPTGGENSTGLGLLIAKQLIELNNGKIWLDDSYESGSKFIIELPAVV